MPSAGVWGVSEKFFIVPHLRSEKEKHMEPGLFSKYAYSEKVITHPDYDYVYISPHLDDVPLSCSGTICQQKIQGFNILVVTVFAADPQPPFSPFVQSFHRAWEAADETPYQVRKVEERKAMAVLNVDYAWFDWLEILYRDPVLSELIELFCEPGNLAIHPQDAPIFATLCNWLADLRLAYPRAQMVVPLSLGGHRDHRLIFRASLDALDRTRLLFFEDFPYATYQAEELTELVKQYILTPIEVDISDCLEQRIQTAESYQSQLPALYYSASQFLDLIREYTSTLGGQKRFVERYWKLAQTNTPF
jgi:LmbE family N-acetylglucosaminyl deacetylase